MNAQIQNFIDSEHIAVVGVSKRKFGGTIYKALKKRGLNVYPVHPTMEALDGDRCFAGVSDLPENVEAAVIAVSPESSEGVVDDAKGRGISKLWFQQGANFSKAVAKAEALGIQTVSRKCVLMYAGNVTGIHAFHRTLAKLFGRY